MLVLGQEARNGHVVPRGRAPRTGPGSADGRDGHGKDIRHALGSRNGAHVHGAVMFDAVVCDGGVGEGRGFQHRVVHEATVGRSIRRRRTNRVGTRTPDFLELGRGNVGTVVGGDGGPELLAARLVDGTETVGVDDLGLVSDTGVDAEGVVRLGRLAGGHGTRLGEEDLVLVAAGRVAYRSGPRERAAGVAHGRAVAG